MKHLRIEPRRYATNNSLEKYADEFRANLDSALRLVEQVSGVPVSRFPDQPITENEVKVLIKLRRNRNRFFDAEMFADPAWDILLELYAARLGQQKISVGSLCQAAAVPATTALRWIALLQNKGLIERKADPMDGRRFHVSLSDTGFRAMASYFRTVPISAAVI